MQDEGRIITSLGRNYSNYIILSIISVNILPKLLSNACSSSRGCDGWGQMFQMSQKPQCYAPIDYRSRGIKRITFDCIFKILTIRHFLAGFEIVLEFHTRQNTFLLRLTRSKQSCFKNSRNPYTSPRPLIHHIFSYYTSYFFTRFSRYSQYQTNPELLFLKTSNRSHSPGFDPLGEICVKKSHFDLVFAV